MAGVKFEKGSTEWYMFQEYWKLCQKYWIPEDNDSYWDAMYYEACQFMEKYKDIPLAVELGAGFVAIQDRQLRAKLKGNLAGVLQAERV